MPTTHARTTLTHTSSLERMLTTAARHWPDAHSARELIVLLMAEGVSSLREKELEAAYADAYADWAGSEDAAMWDLASGDGLDEAR